MSVETASGFRLELIFVKTLIIGIDGGDNNVHRGFSMPFLRSLESQLAEVKVTEDLWSRGWIEVLTGRTTPWTGGAFSIPKLDGSHRFSQVFRSQDVTRNPEIRPIWVLTGEAGMSIGMMNVPGTDPAPEVKGFCVSGFDSFVSRLHESHCYPKGAREVLERCEYQADFRFEKERIRGTGSIFSSLMSVMQKRARGYLALCHRFQPDIGFVVFTETGRMQNIAMSEVQSYLRKSEFEEIRFNTTPSAIHTHLENLYQGLDGVIESLVSTLQPKHLILLSDHGAVPYKYSANVDALLAEAGFYVPCNPETLQLYATTKKFQSSFSKRVLAKVRGRAYWNKTKAFGQRHIPGIYINDERFGGPVAKKDTRSLINEIVDQFNGTKEGKLHSMDARNYREAMANTPFERLLPDIWIEKSDEIFFEGVGPLLQPNEDYGPMSDFYSVSRDLFNGVKGRHPIFYADGATMSLGEVGDEKNLTFAYNLLARQIQQ